jgi:hypothetical protein
MALIDPELRKERKKYVMPAVRVSVAYQSG